MENSQHKTMFDNLNFFDDSDKKLRDRTSVKDLMKNAKYDDTVMVVFRLLASLQNYKAKIKYALEMAQTESDCSHTIDFNSKFNSLKKEYDSVLAEFFDIIEFKKEKDLATFLEHIEETIGDMKAEDIAKIQTLNLFKQEDSNPNEDFKYEQLEYGMGPKKVKFQTDMISEKKGLKIIHFNDVYNIDEKQTEPVSGYSRFYTAMNSFNHCDQEKPLILFSGDIFAPSKLSIFYEGDHMIPFLKKAGIHWAWVGNHDFDFGDAKLGELISETNFPWLLSNVKWAKTGVQLSNTVEHVVIDHEGYRVAIIGLAEVQWFEALNVLDIDDIVFENYVECAQRYVKTFKEDRSDIDFLIALTHMRNPRDINLGLKVPELDLILGGHDHQTVNFQPNNILIRKSGTDFREFSLINLTLHNLPSSEFQTLTGLINSETKDKHLDYGVWVKDLSNLKSKNKTLIAEFQKIEVTSEFERDPELHQQTLKFTEDINEKLKLPVGYTANDLESTFSKIRFEETNLSNLMADMVNLAHHTDITLINAGTYRTDAVIPAGFITMKDIMDMLPMLDNMMVVKVSGEIVHKLLENGISSYPELQGKFPSISGCTFEFDPKKDPGQRIEAKDIYVQGEQLDYIKEYSIATKYFLYRGKDGYTDFENAKVIINDADGIVMSNMLIHNFDMLEERHPSQHLDDLCKVVGNEEKELSPEYEKKGEKHQCIMIKPKLDGRIKIKSD